MIVDWDAIGKAGIAVLGVAGAALQLRSEGRGRRVQLRKDAELLKTLPENSKAYEMLAAHIDRQVDQLVERETLRTREPFSIVLGLVILVAGIYVGYLGIAGGSWWLLVTLPTAVFLILLAIAGLARGIPKKVRDAAGRPIEDKKPEQAQE
ncbi:hypothetical protein GCM10009681_45870 [Luedemannella helvata]|uniref:Uncharacterized protein n=1 Tax=Luedemannella helvata TaxID=349315 RepID=A0ABP4X3B2_9ACTN